MNAKLRPSAMLLVAFVALGAAVAAAQRDEGPILLPKPKPASATLLVMCDLACNWKLDGEAKGRIEAGGTAKAKVGVGQHVVVAATEDGADRLQQLCEIKAAEQKVVNIELGPVRSARLKAEPAAREKVQPADATLLVLCDLACNWKLDGVEQGRVAAGGSARATVEIGQHVVAAATEDGTDQVRQLTEVKSSGQTVASIDLASVRRARIKTEQDAAESQRRESNTGPGAGRVRGQVTNPSGAPQSGGTVSLYLGTTVIGANPAGTASVDQNGGFSVNAAAGSYTLIYRTPGLSEDKETDSIKSVTVISGQETRQDVDMSREEFVSKLPAGQWQQLSEIRRKNAVAMAANETIRSLNADLLVVRQDLVDADHARATAKLALGSSASAGALDARETEIKHDKYSEAESLMSRDASIKPDASILWAQLGQAQLGLKEYSEGERSFRQALTLEGTAKKPNPAIQSASHAGLGEILARSGRVAEARAAYDEAAAISPAQAGFYYKNEAVIFYQVGNADAQVAAAEEAIQANPSEPLPYYLLGQGLVQKATINARTGRLVAPPRCLEAYRKYLELAPDGPYASETRKILATF